MSCGKIIVILTAFFVTLYGFTVEKGQFSGQKEAFLELQNEFTTFLKKFNASKLHKQEIFETWGNVSHLFEEILSQFGQNYQHIGKLPPDPDAKRNATELIRNKGLEADEHYVTTADGFILLVIRVRSPRIKPHPDKLPVFLLHGLLSSCDCYINNLRNESLAFILADMGYDVWLGNIRGNRYTTRHQHLHPNDKEFWKWSFDEMGQYDVPVMVDFVLSQTGHKKLDFIGHSEGCTNLITSVVSQGRPMSDRVNKFIALAPAAYVSHSKGLLKALAKFAKIIQKVWNCFGEGDVFAHNGYVADFAEKYCYDIPHTCSIILHAMVGTGLSHYNTSRTPMYLSHAPAGTSTQNMVHWSQQCEGGNQLIYYDYGSRWKNYQHYKKFKPPAYDLSKFTVPTYVFLGDLDWLVAPPDGRAVVKDLPNVKWTKIFPDFNHIDFVWGYNIANTVNRDILNILDTK
uniref:gastric triacylglycerol lipase-like n=1 Tax=Styela clava TaxID=7725 RepID=UPI0019396556|nr:gastric triacylglycerol lipase-like [Styela clava]